MGDCALGAKNATAIEDIKDVQKERNTTIRCLRGKGDSIEKDKIGARLFYRFIIVLMVVFTGIFGTLWANLHIVNAIKTDVAVIAATLKIRLHSQPMVAYKVNAQSSCEAREK